MGILFLVTRFSPPIFAIPAVVLFPEALVNDTRWHVMFSSAHRFLHHDQTSAEILRNSLPSAVFEAGWLSLSSAFHHSECLRLITLCGTCDSENRGR